MLVHLSHQRKRAVPSKAQPKNLLRWVAAARGAMVQRKWPWTAVVVEASKWPAPLVKGTPTTGQDEAAAERAVTPPVGRDGTPTEAPSEAPAHAFF